MNYFEKSISSINEVFSFLGTSLTASQIKFLRSVSVSRSLSPPKSISEQFSLTPSDDIPLPTIDQILNSDNLEESFLQYNEINEILSDIALNLLLAFFRASQNNYCFVDPYAIKKKFGKTINAAYPRSSPEFISFAESFWTLRLMHNELVLTHKGFNVTLLYGWLEFNIGSIFFPSGDGHPMIPLQRRIDAQRKIMNFVGYQKIEAFISGNPLLRNQQNNAQTKLNRSGCFGVFFLLTISLSLLISVGIISIIY